jgi:hypothetical protein
MLDLVKVLSGEPDQKEFKFGDKKIVFRTLRQSEMNEVMLKMPRTDLTLIELEKIPILARTLVSIDGVDLKAFDEVREAIKKDDKIDVYNVVEDLLSKIDTNVINILYNIYTEFREESLKKRELLKNA